ncbi:YHS domain-containing (seleno)protein [Paraglaciecola polaris]|uniref:YHS protein n=1 Tax=Paraglaciecola polaris LMG 21857 TaxID=1129793 RepID=K6ZT23_9ALTE|nr:YHS domain-containing (seleno)protein [Paraglaciecola polaris]GAC31978.1 YHS protein [Paraglaciecola polaris LMG 21857]|tara:strand:- start:1404 stop:1871 length:468 start_codon:yes stop_codon:yes gene_type:complete
MKNLFTLKSLFTAVAISVSSLSFAGVDTQTDSNDVILAGHDAVAYFTQNKPVLGKSEFTAVHNDAIYRFSSAANRDAFNSNPEKYAPAYGGFCAFGTTFGKKFEIDGKAFEIVDGKLYVNKNLDVYQAWKKDIPKHLVEAQEQWPTIEFTPSAQL